VTDITPLADKPPARRYHVTQHIEYLPPGAAAAVDVWLSVGIMPAGTPEAGRIFEVFLRGQGKVGSERDFLLDDIAVLISHLLRMGMTAGGISRMLAAPLEDGRPASVIAAVCEEIDRMQRAIIAGAP
jgi:hypothetical protein